MQRGRKRITEDSSSRLAVFGLDGKQVFPEADLYLADLYLRSVKPATATLLLKFSKATGRRGDEHGIENQENHTQAARRWARSFILSPCQAFHL